MLNCYAWIRFFKYLLYIIYKLPLKAWQTRGIENKKMLKLRKKKNKGKI